MTSGIIVAVKRDPASDLSPGMKPQSGATKTYEFSPLSDPRWETFIARHPQASVFHSISWLRALQATYGYEPLGVTTCAPHMALDNGLIFCRIKSWLTGWRFVSLPFSDHCEPLVGNSHELDDLLCHMRQYVDSGKWRYVEIRPISNQPEDLTALSARKTYVLHCVDLDRSKQELFRRLQKDSIQRKIRRAEREKLKYEEGSSDTLLAKFYELLVMTRRRQYLPPQPLSWFRALIASFGSQLKIRMAWKGDLPVASILTIRHKNTLVYKYGCSNAQFHRLGGIAFLLWKGIEEAKDLGLEHLDMGRSDTHNLGLVSFKQRWGALATQLNYWTYARSPLGPPEPWKGDLLRRVVPVTPNFVLKVVGKLLYGHIG
jgi:CelD/BcsL family acetyltransferase involved in cellulose biosynthesis